MLVGSVPESRKIGWHLNNFGIAGALNVLQESISRVTTALTTRPFPLKDSGTLLYAPPSTERLYCYL
jgi:hypothetical protein